MNVQLAFEPVCIEADPGQVQQVIINLITNASEAIGEKPGRIILATGVMDCEESFLSKSLLKEKPPAGRYAYLDVTDDGQGMDEETIKRIFDPFFTTKFTGRGLGMSAVLGIIRSHKGAITIESIPGRGTNIRVLFPACETTGAGLTDAFCPSRELADTTHFSGTILVVDDEDMVREVCAAMLQRLGFRTMTAADGEEALLLLQKHSAEISLALLDMTMPKMDGFSTFQAMRRLKPDVKVIICSGYSEEDATQRFAGSGSNGFIKKPFHIKDLQEKVANALRN